MRSSPNPLALLMFACVLFTTRTALSQQQPTLHISCSTTNVVREHSAVDGSTCVGHAYDPPQPPNDLDCELRMGFGPAAYETLQVQYNQLGPVATLNADLPLVFAAEGYKRWEGPTNVQYLSFPTTCDGNDSSVFGSCSTFIIRQTFQTCCQINDVTTLFLTVEWYADYNGNGPGYVVESSPTIQTLYDSFPEFIQQVFVPAGVAGHFVEDQTFTSGPSCGGPGCCCFTRTTARYALAIGVLPLKIEVIDRNPGLLSSGDPPLDPAGIVNSNLSRDAVAADGVTEVVLRHEVLGPGIVEFALADPNGGPSGVNDIGRLASLDGLRHDETSIPVVATQIPNTDRWFALAVYTAPPNYLSASQYRFVASRHVRMTAQYQPYQGNGTTTAFRDIQIRRPPVVLVHGLWGNRKAWGDNDDVYLGDSNFKVFRVDYKDTHASGFVANKLKLRDAITEIIANVRNPLINCAATQADVIAHSMGGVLAHLYVQGFGGVQYRRADNFNEGTIHKLITIDTPHEGSPMANILLKPGLGYSLLRFVFGLTNHNVNDGAVADLQIGSDANILMGSSYALVRTHTIVGTGGRTVLSDPAAAAQMPGSERLIGNMVDWLDLEDTAFPFGQNHDLIVSATSQTGNISQTVSYPFVDGHYRSGTHDLMVPDQRVRADVVELLYADVLDAQKFADAIPPYVQTAPPTTAMFGSQVNGLVMVSPPASTSYSSGDQITIVIAPTNGFQPVRTLVVSQFDAAVLGPGEFIAILDVPANAVGPLTVFAAAYDANFDFAQTDQTVLQVVPPATLIGLSIDPEIIELTRFGPTTSLDVTGHYSDGIDRDLTLGVNGTTYQSSDGGVATVSVDGLVTSVGFGTCTIAAMKKSFTAVAQVEVTGLPCLPDINEDNATNIDDLVEVITHWGPCYACRSDIDGNGVVDIDDLVRVITGWGPCPESPSPFNSVAPAPNFGCIDAIKWGEYLQILAEGTPEQVECYNCWAVYHLLDCAGQWKGGDPGCGCNDPF